MSPSPNNDLERIHELEKNVSLLQKDSEVQNKILDKLDVTVENIHDLAQSMHRMVSIHEERFRVQDKENTQLEQLIAERREESVAEVKAVRTKIDQMEGQFFAKIEEVRKDVASSRDLIVKLSGEEDPKAKNEKKDDKGYILRVVVDNWKYILFVFAFGAGLVSHKWGFLKDLIGG